MQLILAIIALLAASAPVVVYSKESHNLRHLAKDAAQITNFTPGASIRASAGKQRGFDADARNNGDFDLVYKFDGGMNIQVKSNPKTGTIQIRKIGNAKSLSAEDRAFLQDLAATLEATADIDTNNVDELGTQSMRAARLLSEWPETLNQDFDYTPEDDQDREQREIPDQTGLPPVPKFEGGGNRQLQRYEKDTSGHHYRKLAYTSLCQYVNNYWVPVTHDDWNYNNWDDRTSFYAILSMHPDGPCSDGTYFSQTGLAGSWSCYEPDHSSSIEYAYGGCFGRCGAGCGSGTQFTQDCADHDSCVRFGHTLASVWCDDEFSFTVDDALYAPNCL